MPMCRYSSHVCENFLNAYSTFHAISIVCLEGVGFLILLAGSSAEYYIAYACHTVAILCPYRDSIRIGVHWRYLRPMANFVNSDGPECPYVWDIYSAVLGGLPA